MNRVRKIWYTINLIFRKGGFARAQYCRKKNLFGSIGENVYYHPYMLPSEPELMHFHNNVWITSGVLFITHDIIGGMLNYLEKSDSYHVLFDKIEIFDNVSIGANTMILPGVTIGPNVIVAAGSVVTKSWGEKNQNIIIGGNPAHIIKRCGWDDLKNRRRESK